MKYMFAICIAFCLSTAHGQNKKMETLTIKRYYEDGKIVKVDSLWEETNSFENESFANQWDFKFDENDSLFHSYMDDDNFFNWDTFNFSPPIAIDSLLMEHLKKIEEQTKHFENQFYKRFQKHKRLSPFNDSIFRIQMKKMEKKIKRMNTKIHEKMEKTT